MLNSGYMSTSNRMPIEQTLERRPPPEMANPMAKIDVFPASQVANQGMEKQRQLATLTNQVEQRVPTLEYPGSMMQIGNDRFKKFPLPGQRFGGEKQDGQTQQSPNKVDPISSPYNYRDMLHVESLNDKQYARHNVQKNRDNGYNILTNTII